MSRQYFLFHSVKTDKGTVSLKEEPFFHIEVVSGKTRLMLPVEALSAGRLIDGLTVTERKLIRKMLGGIIAENGEV